MITKNNFEEKLYNLNNQELLHYDKRTSVDYETQKVTYIHLYYNDNGHIGTWIRGGNGTIFKERLPKIKGIS